MLKSIRRLTRKKRQPAAEQSPAAVPPGLGPQVAEIFHEVQPYTMTSVERIEALCKAVKYVCTSGAGIDGSTIEGAIVECGVWRGGSMMAAAMQLLRCEATERDLFLYDTYEGMSAPTERDIDHSGNSAAVLMQEERYDPDDSRSIWCLSRLEEVEANLKATGYPEDRLHFVKGRVEETIPDSCPDRIAILRLDTDWYESTRHELEHLYPRLVPGGVLIIDDYGHWQGCRRAVDEYFAQSARPVLLNRIDYTGRIAVKTA